MTIHSSAHNLKLDPNNMPDTRSTSPKSSSIELSKGERTNSKNCSNSNTTMANKKKSTSKENKKHSVSNSENTGSNKKAKANKAKKGVNSKKELKTPVSLLKGGYKKKPAKVTRCVITDKYVGMTTLYQYDQMQSF